MSIMKIQIIIKGINMKKISSIKEQKTKEFILALKEHTGPLTSFFRNWARLHGLAMGSVRNAYYSIAKKSRENKAFCDKYFGGNPLEVTKSTLFSREEENELIDNVKKGIAQGKSVRSILLSLAGGDAKKALRLQNKYRNYMRLNHKDKPIKNYFNNNDYSSIKAGIDNLVSSICERAKMENQDLKRQIYYLQLENLKLKAQSGVKRQSALDILLGNDVDDVN